MFAIMHVHVYTRLSSRESHPSNYDYNNDDNEQDHCNASNSNTIYNIIKIHSMEISTTDKL